VGDPIAVMVADDLISDRDVAKQQALLNFQRRPTRIAGT